MDNSVTGVLAAWLSPAGIQVGLMLFFGGALWSKVGTLERSVDMLIKLQMKGRTDEK